MSRFTPSTDRHTHRAIQFVGVAVLWSIAAPLPAQFPAENGAENSPEQQTETVAPCCKCESKPMAVSIRQEKYMAPNVTLVASDGKQMSFAKLVHYDGPVVLQFAFTTCSTVCPVLSSTTAEVQKQLAAKVGDQAQEVRFITVSIDPEYDSPQILKEYASSLSARANWHFLTGRPDDIANIRKAFKAYTFNKSRHEALTFLLDGARFDDPSVAVNSHAGPKEWTRITGFISAEDLTTRICHLLERSKPGDPELGKRIYRDGVLPDGSRLTALVAGDVPIHGKFASCAKCHRRSGYGSDEPGKIVPAITGTRLFDARIQNRAEELRSLFQEPQTDDESTSVRIPRNRPAYTESTLLTALREGHDPTGHQFGALKPRYELSDANGRHLIAYLKTLGTEHPPGVDANTIHFATIVTDDVPDDAQAAFLKTIKAFVETRNHEVARYRSRPGLSPNYKSDLIPSYRKWQVHVWHLKGSPADYGLQLVSHYDDTPVFGVLSGLSTSDWQPIDRFCNHREIPCVFPITAYPAQRSSAAGYTLYLDRGLTAQGAREHDPDAFSDVENDWKRIEAHGLPRSYRIQAWFRARGLKLTHPDLQFRTHFAFHVASFALGHMIERHSRDYFIERIEHETENALNPGTHKTLSLGPGQRFASGNDPFAQSPRN